MQCDKCGAAIEKQEAHDFHGQLICEDCYIDVLSPSKACDPWAVYSAKSFSSSDSAGSTVTATQSKILQLLKETGGAEPRVLSERLQLSPSDLEREIATLRHMEKLRAELRDGKKVICLW